MNRSAGLVLFRFASADIEVLVGHMGGPLWAGKEEGAWSIPKGLVAADDADEWTAAQREFAEEMGYPAPTGTPIDLGVFRQSRGKEIHIWALGGDLDATKCSSNEFEMEWPPKSGRVQRFPEVDRAAWFDLATAKTKVVAGQRPVLDALSEQVTPHS